VLLAVATVVWTDTRGQLFAAVIAGIVLLPLSRRMTNWKGFVGTGVTVVLLLGAASVLVDVIVGEESRWSGETMTETWQASRLETSKIVLEAWADGGPVRWVVGLGYEASFAPSLLGAYPHLVMLQALAEQGIIGFVLLWLVVLLAARSVVRLWPRVTDDPNQRGLIAGLAALFLFEVILSFKQGSTLAFYNAYAFAVILGRLEMTVPEPAHAEPDAAESAHGSDEAWDDDPCDPDGLPGDAEGYDDYALPDRRPVHAGSAF
jgi:O-antigen ligase